MTTFHLNFGPTSQSRSMVTTLHNSASKLAQMIQPPVLHARKTVTTTITRTEVIEAEIPMQYVPDAFTTTFDDVMAAPSMTQEEDDLQVEHQPSSDDFLLSLVQEEQRNHVGRVRWKTSITPQWNSWSSEHLKIDPMTSQQVKNRYYYLQNKVQHPIPNDLATIGESSSQQIPLTPVQENTTSMELTLLLATLVSIEDHDPSSELNVQRSLSIGDVDDHSIENVDDHLKSIPLSDIPSTSNTFISPKNMSSWEQISSTIVPQGPPRAPYSARESELFIFLLNTPSKQAKYKHGARSTIDWMKFNNRWKYWCQAETAFGSRDFMLRSDKQLK